VEAKSQPKALVVAGQKQLLHYSKLKVDLDVLFLSVAVESSKKLHIATMLALVCFYYDSPLPRTWWCGGAPAQGRLYGSEGPRANRELWALYAKSFLHF